MYTTLQDTHAFIINKFGIYIYLLLYEYKIIRYI